jgi:hypothetical protein
MRWPSASSALEAQLLTPDAVDRIVAKAAVVVESALEHGEHEPDREKLAAVDRKLRRKIGSLRGRGRRGCGGAASSRARRAAGRAAPAARAFSPRPR